MASIRCPLPSHLRILPYLLGHLVELELSARFLAVSRVLRDDAFLDGLVETGDKFLELLRRGFLVVGVGGLEELLVRIVQFRLAHGVALARLLVLTIALACRATSLGVSHFLCPFLEMFARIISK